MKLQDVASFFHDLSPQILKLAAENYKTPQQTKRKVAETETINFVTQTDIEIENLITTFIAKHFPQDQILAEEKFSETKLNPIKRLWIIDPLCGTANFAKGMKLFCTNIALAQNGQLIASCVIDHSEQEYIWSIGNQKLFVGNNEINTQKTTSGIEIEVDLSSMNKIGDEFKKKYLDFIYKLGTQTNYTMVSHTTSLSFAYTALGKIDAYISPKLNLWDEAAGNFLTMQSGGIVTDLQGNPWTLDATNVVAARNKDLHTLLISLLNTA